MILLYPMNSCYEIAFHIIPTLTEKEAQDIIEKIKAAVTSHKGSLITKGECTKTPLQYSIRYGKGAPYSYFDEAYFGSIKFNAQKSDSMSIEQAVRGILEILRFIMYTTDEESTRVDEKLMEDIKKEIATKEEKKGGTRKKEEMIDLPKKQKDKKESVASTVENGVELEKK